MQPREGLTLTFEAEGTTTVRSLSEIELGLQRLSPRGPSYMILDAAGGDFAQVAGGEDGYTVEWRDRSGHWVAGISGLTKNDPTTIRTATSRVTIYENERLTAAAAAEILGAFGHGRWRPAKYVWREVHHDRRNSRTGGKGD